jgi:hypothetical protein
MFLELNLSKYGWKICCAQHVACHYLILLFFKMVEVHLENRMEKIKAMEDFFSLNFYLVLSLVN